MDMTDMMILKELRKDARESMGSISERLGISKATVSRRIGRLEREGVIDRFTLEVNLTGSGVIEALLFIEVSGSSVNTVIEELQGFEHIMFVYKVFGDHSLICKLFSNSVDELYSLIQDHITVLQNVSNIQVDILVDRVDLNMNADLDLVPLR